MTSDEARDALPGRGDIKDELEDLDVDITDIQAEKFLAYLIEYMATEDDEEDEEIEDELDDEIEEDALKGDEEGIDHA
jgi:hypothetical protein